MGDCTPLTPCPRQPAGDQLSQELKRVKDELERVKGELGTWGWLPWGWRAAEQLTPPVLVAGAQGLQLCGEGAGFLSGGRAGPQPLTCLLPPADRTAQCEAYRQTISSLQAQLRAAGMSPRRGEPLVLRRLQGCSCDPLPVSVRAARWKGQSSWPSLWGRC